MAEASSDLNGSTIISAGLGEDASFDIEFATRFGARVIIVDPTPRAIADFEAIQRRIGKSAAESYAQSGKQPATAYDLQKLNSDAIVLERYALWTEEGETLPFYSPPNPEYVSHSVVNYQNDYSESTPHIEVQTTTFAALMSKYRLSELPLVKIDIEGAEIPVIPDMLSKGIHSRQVLVEFDEMSVPSPRSKENIEKVDSQLRQAGYVCRHHDGISNFWYVRIGRNWHRSLSKIPSRASSRKYFATSTER